MHVEMLKILTVMKNMVRLPKPISNEQTKKYQTPIAIRIKIRGGHDSESYTRIMHKHVLGSFDLQSNGMLCYRINIPTKHTSSNGTLSVYRLWSFVAR